MRITKKQKDKIKKLAKKYDLKMVLLFGSQATGKTHKESDIDIAFLPEKKISFKDDYYLNYEFTNIFQNDKIDTVNLRGANPLLMYAIFKNPKILYEKDRFIFYNYENYAFKRYVEEAKPLCEIKFSKLSKKINSLKI